MELHLITLHAGQKSITRFYFRLSAATFHNQFIYKMPRGARQHQNKYWSHFTIHVIDNFNFAKEMWTIGPDSNLNVISLRKQNFQFIAWSASIFAFFA